MGVLKEKGLCVADLGVPRGRIAHVANCSRPRQASKDLGVEAIGNQAHVHLLIEARLVARDNAR